MTSLVSIYIDPYIDLWYNTGVRWKRGLLYWHTDLITLGSK